jgi:HPt (histidine-containing phosphotransfer) domain-containing protein
LLDIVDGDRASVAEILSAALVLIDTDLARIDDAARDGDMELLAEAAHRMKGTSGSIRSIYILELSGRLQQLARQNTLGDEDGVIASLHAAVADLRRDIEAHGALLHPV